MSGVPIAFTDTTYLPYNCFTLEGRVRHIWLLLTTFFAVSSFALPEKGSRIRWMDINLAKADSINSSGIYPKIGQSVPEAVGEKILSDLAELEKLKCSTPESGLSFTLFGKEPRPGAYLKFLNQHAKRIEVDFNLVGAFAEVDKRRRPQTITISSKFIQSIMAAQGISFPRMATLFHEAWHLRGARNEFEQGSHLRCPDNPRNPFYFSELAGLPACNNKFLSAVTTEILFLGDISRHCEISADQKFDINITILKALRRVTNFPVRRILIEEVFADDKTMKEAAEESFL